MDGHLVAVEVGGEAAADERVDADGVALDEDGLEGLDTHAVERGCTVEQDGVLVDDLFEDVPDFCVAALEHALGGFDGVGEAVVLELADDEGLVELECDLLGQAALVELELGADDDDGARGVVDALAEQVLAEAALLALDHVGETLERAVRRADDGAAAAVVVEQGVDGLLEHPLLVADDHVGRVEVHQLLEAVVAVDDAAVEVVEVAGGEVAALEKDEGAEVRRDDGDDIHDEPGGVVVGLADLLYELEALGEVLGLLLRAGCLELVAEGAGLFVEVGAGDEFADGVGAHGGAELVAELIDCFAVLVLGEEGLEDELLAGLEDEGGVAVDDDVVLVVDALFEVGGLHAQQRAEAAGEAFEEPDMDDGGGEVDVTHALAADAGVGDLDAAAVADDALELGAFVLAAGALVVALRPEDTLTEKTTFFRLECPVVNGLGIFNFSAAPFPNDIGRGDGNSHMVEAIGLALKTEDTDGRFANRSFLIGPDGRIVARYDKMHMFDVTVSQTESYHESKGYRPGERAVVADIDRARLGLSICYDIRFPYLYRALAQAGATILTAPSAFSTGTGPSHWEPLLKARAIETGSFVLAPAQTGTHAAQNGKPRKTYGHSMAISPWGEILYDAGQEPCISLISLDLSQAETVRDSIPSLTHTRSFTGPE